MQDLELQPTGILGQVRVSVPRLGILFFHVSEVRAVKPATRGGSKIELLSGAHYFVGLEPSQVLEVFDEAAAGVSDEE